jgi:hypothetical protein
MHSSRLAIAASVLILILASSLDSRHLLLTNARSLHLWHEAVRLRAHFDSVDSELGRRDVLLLSAERRESRATLRGWLREYRDEGRFPVNDRFPDRAMPFFRDGQGALCAMAYLIGRSGRPDLVDRIASTRNNAFVAELANDAELSGWLDSVGLSLGEAARIQPSYEPVPEVPEDQAVKASYALTSIVVSGASFTTFGINLISPSRPSAWAGVIAGSAAIIAGAANLDGPGDSDKVAAANLIAGVCALAGGVYRLIGQRADRPMQGLSIGPIVSSSPGSRRLGLAIEASF